MQTETLTNKQARRFVLRWQGLLGAPRFAKKDGALAFVRQAGCLQYDPVDICGKNAELMLFSRVKGFAKPMLDSLLYEDRALIDHWDKNMALCPAEDWPALVRNRRRFRGWSYTEESRRAVEGALPHLRAAIQKRGVLSSGDVALDEKIDWPWAPARLSRAALEYMYFTGELCIHHRSGTKRYYAAAQNHLPEELLKAPSPHKADTDYYAWHTRRRIAAVGLLWNRPSDAFLAIPDYSAAVRENAFARLQAEERIFAVQVEGMAAPLYAVAEARPFLEEAKREDAPSAARVEFIAPLDSLLWDRKLAKALFGLDYKWEIYTPSEKRRYGAYVLPVLWRDGFAGRIAMRAERPGGTLFVENFWPEEGMRTSKAFWGKMNRRVQQLARFHGCTGTEGAEMWPL